MAVTVQVAQDNSFLADQIIGELSGFSVNEEATPLTPGDSSGGTPTFSVSGVGRSRWAMANDQTMVLDTGHGTVVGTVNNTDADLAAGTLSLTADTLLNRLNIDVRALPYYTKVGDLASDNFNRVSPTALGVLSSGQTWKVWRGSFIVNGNQAAPTSSLPLTYATVDVGMPDQKVSAKVTAVGVNATAGVIARLSDLLNYVWADYSATGVWRLGTVYQGVQTVLQTGTGATVGSTLTLTANGNLFTLDINGIRVANRTYSPNNIRVGSMAGIITNGTAGSPNTRWDDFTVTKSGAADQNLYNAFINLTRLAGVPDSAVEVDPEVQFNSVLFPGFVGNLWDYIKQMCVAYGLQCCSSESRIRLIRADKVIIDARIPAGTSMTIATEDVAQRVALKNYQYTAVTSSVFFKSEDVYSLEAGETQEVSVKVNGTPALVNDPVCVSGMNLTMTTGAGQYVVTGEDGYIMSPQLWRDLGGSVTARVSDEAADEIILTMRAPEDTSRAPYRLSEGEDRPALWVTGAGLLSDPVDVVIHTGATNAPQVLIDPVDNIFIGSTAMAYTAGSRLAAAYSGPTITLNLSGVPDLGLTRIAYTYVVPPFATQYAVAAEELGTWMGLISGALLRFGDAVYRVKSAVVNSTSVDLALTQYTRISDFNTVWSGKTFDQFDIAMGPDIAFEQLNVYPLTTGI